MIKKRVVLIMLCVIIGVFFTFAIYSFDIEQRIVRYISISVFYMLIYLIISNKQQLFPDYLLCLIILASPVLIDASVLLTTPNLVPLRFPFASTFSVSGLFLGYLLKNRPRKYFILALLAFSFYCVISVTWLIPRIIYSMETRALRGNNTNPSVEASFFSSAYLKADGDTTSIATYFTGKTIIEIFFVGCRPCEEKKRMLYEIARDLPQKELSILFICDGSLTSKKEFLEYVKWQTINPHITYLYDYNKVLKKELGDIPGYPFEIDFKAKSAVKFYLGFNDETKFIMKSERIKILNLQ